MDRLAEVLLVNAASALALAAAVTLLARFVRRPEVVHVLWVVVLLRLLASPAFEIAALPAQWTAPAAVSSVAGLAAGSGAADGPWIAAAGAATAWSLDDVLPALPWLWIAGTALVIAVTLSRLRRFRRALSECPLADGDVARSAEPLARKLGVAACPPIRTIDGRLPPMLWGRPGRCEILFPRELLTRIDDDERDALIAHELAHVRRRDHWVRWLELAGSALFWWNPVVWWTRRNLRIAEERSCDALVLRALPDRAEAYASGLFKTVEFLADRGERTPAFATGAGETRQLKERLTMIVNRTVPRRLTSTQRWALGSVAICILLVFPTFAERPAPTETEATSSNAEHHTELIELEREQRELEHRLRELQERQLELQHADDRQRAATELRDVEQRALALEAEGRPDDARRAREAAERIARDLERARLAIEGRHDLGAEAGDARIELQRALLAAEQARQRGDSAAAAEIDREARELDRRIRDSMRAAQHEARRDDRRLTAEAIREHQALAQELGQASAAEQDRARQLALEAQQIDEAARQVELQQEQLRALRNELTHLKATRDQLAAADRSEEAAAMEDRIRALTEQLKRIEREQVTIR